MWNDDEDINENGEPIILYSPVQAPPRKANIALEDSHIGGHHCFAENCTPVCDVCPSTMLLLAQLRLQQQQPLAVDNNGTYERYLLVFICPCEECFGQIVFNDGFSLEGGQGRVKCIEKKVMLETNNATNGIKNKSVPISGSSWGTGSDLAHSNIGHNGIHEDSDDDWGEDGQDEQEIDLENAVAAMENNLDKDGSLIMKISNVELDDKKKKKNAINPSPKALDSNAFFNCYLLKTQNEPQSVRTMCEDDDDVGLSESDEKIRNMLARYMAEEDDEFILSALGGGGGGGGGGNNNSSAEQDERLSDDDRILRSFQDRQRRVPRQVIRYAPGGKPLWSIPEINRESGKILWTVPNCSHCREKTTFEMQLLPSVLSTLEVDKLKSVKKKDGENKDKLALNEILSNGINFGSIAVFTCPNASCGIKEGFAVIQRSVDDLPQYTKERANKSIGLDKLNTVSMAVVEDLDDDDEFEPDT